MYDYLAYFAKVQVIADGTAVEGTKCIDLENATIKRQIGVGKTLYLEVWATSTGDDSANSMATTVNTHTAAIVAGSGTTLASSGAVLLPNTTSKLMWQIALPMTGMLRYLGVIFDATAVSGASAVSVSAYITETPQAFTAYDSALTVA